MGSASELGGQRLILTFHGLGPVPARIDDDERPYWCSKSTYHALLDEVKERTDESDRPIQITFDDGNYSDLAIGLPALVERGLRADFFVCGGRLGRSGYLDESGVRALASAGMGIGSHGWGHIDWRTANDGEMELEVDRTRELLSEVVGLPVDEVAIPFGSYDRRVLGLLRRGGVRTAYTMDGGFSGDGWLPSRVSCGESWNVPLLHTALKAAHLRASARKAVARLLKRIR